MTNEKKSLIQKTKEIVVDKIKLTMFGLGIWAALNGAWNGSKFIGNTIKDLGEAEYIRKEIAALALYKIGEERLAAKLAANLVYNHHEYYHPVDLKKGVALKQLIQKLSKPLIFDYPIKTDVETICIEKVEIDKYMLENIVSSYPENSSKICMYVSGKKYYSKGNKEITEEFSKKFNCWELYDWSGLNTTRGRCVR